MIPDSFVVAIDGPSGAGKTAAGERLAQRLGAILIDTGIFYRGLTHVALTQHVDTANEPGLLALIQDLDAGVRLRDAGSAAEVLFHGEPVGDAIFSAEVDARVSEVAAHPGVRSALLDLQRTPATGRRAVVTGRDIGTVVFPDADVKIFLNASPDERARRRALQVGAHPEDRSVANAMVQRDATDSTRLVAPLTRAADAIVIETDALSLDTVVDAMDAFVRERVGRAP